MATTSRQEKSGLIFEARKIVMEALPMVDCHLHTSWTDGTCSVQEMYTAATKNELEVVLFSEHSRKTSVDWFHDFADDVRSLPIAPCKALVGTEVKVEARSGEIDTIKEISGNCDFVMASVHRLIDRYGNTMQFAETDPSEVVDIEYAMTMAALENPRVNILGHVFGMSLRRFEQTPSPNRLKEVIKKAALNNVVVELNSHYHKNYIQILDLCKKYNALISFGSNAHNTKMVGEMTRTLRATERYA